MVGLTQDLALVGASELVSTFFGANMPRRLFAYLGLETAGNGLI